MEFNVGDYVKTKSGRDRGRIVLGQSNTDYRMFYFGSNKIFNCPRHWANKKLMVTQSAPKLFLILYGLSDGN